MTLPVPLSVRLVTGRTDKYITRRLRDLSFREVAMGGWASLELSLDQPLNIDPDEIAYYGKAYVFDGRNGNIVFEGRLEDPDRTATNDGQVWDLTVIGPAGHARDITRPLVYVDSSLERWIEAEFGSKAALRTRGEMSGGVPCLQIQAMEGQAATTSWEADWIYRAVNEAGQKLARVSVGWDTGVTDANFHNRLYFRTGGGVSPGNAATASWNTAGGTLAVAVGAANFTNGHDVVSIRAARDTSSITPANDTYWAGYAPVAVRAMLMDTSGADVTAGYTLNTVLGHEVVTDLLGRMLPAYDGPNASIATNTYAIEQLVYPDGVDAAKVLDDLVAFEPDHRWGAYESGDTGLYRFEWAAWPTTPRYEADITDGFSAPGSAEGLFNQVMVRWRDAGGRSKATVRTATVAVLDTAGLVRQGYIDLGDEVGNLANANKAGDEYLAEHAVPPNAGSLVVARPIFDKVKGRMVQPWEIKAGELIRVRGVRPRVDSLNATARNGSTVFRVWAKDYRASDHAATLELDSWPVTTPRALASPGRPGPMLLRRR